MDDAGEDFVLDGEAQYADRADAQAHGVDYPEFESEPVDPVRD